MELTVVTECAGWFLRDDGLVQIKNKRAKTVILNELYTKIWLLIDYEITKNKLLEELEKIQVGKELAEQCLDELLAMELINIFNKEDSFDMLFS